MKCEFCGNEPCICEEPFDRAEQARLEAIADYYEGQIAGDP